jgi:hypothetical protein
MTIHQPKTLAECTEIVSDSFAALRDSGLTTEQAYHIGEVVNAYLFASGLATKLGAIAEEATAIAVQSLAR